MISQAATRTGARVTFTVAAKAPVSVVADFNGWDPHQHPLKAGKDGVRSTTVALAPGRYAFRYLAEGGLFFDDPDADVIEENSHGGFHGVVVVPEPAAPAKRATRRAAKVAKAPAAAKTEAAPAKATKATRKRNN